MAEQLFSFEGRFITLSQIERIKKGREVKEEKIEEVKEVSPEVKEEKAEEVGVPPVGTGNDPETTPVVKKMGRPAKKIKE
jgi:hypothetical protein